MCRSDGRDRLIIVNDGRQSAVNDGPPATQRTRTQRRPEGAWTTTHEEDALRAERQTTDLARARKLRVEAITDPSLHHTAAAVLQQIWSRPEGTPLAPELLRAFVHNGNYVGGVFDAERLIAVAAGFRTDHDALHSHIAGVLPQYQGESIGYLLKLHQRAWSLRHGIDVITWTFDPLLRRNAHFNLVKLGATAREYLSDFYGAMTDQINVGDQSDRLLVEWNLRRDVPGEPIVAGSKATWVLAVGPDDEPRSSPPTGAERVIAVPPDIELVRRADPQRAARWRSALRSAVVTAVRDGHCIVGMDADGCYVTRALGSARATAG